MSSNGERISYVMYGRHLQDKSSTVSSGFLSILFRFWPAASRKTQNVSYMLYPESGKGGQGEGLGQGEWGKWAGKGLKRKKPGKMCNILTIVMALIECSAYKVRIGLIIIDLLLILLPSALWPYLTALKCPLGLLAPRVVVKSLFYSNFCMEKYFKDI